MRPHYLQATAIAVVDVETTGLNPYRHDRIIELAALVVTLDGRAPREFVTLINPERDIGPTRVHGLRTQDILGAPRFNEIAGALLESLDGCVALAGHNVRFDHSFLHVEFERLGQSFPDSRTLCTMQLAHGGTLSAVCSRYGISVEGTAHSAQHDARATAQLLAMLLKDNPHLVSEMSCWSPISWPVVPRTPVKLMTRQDSSARAPEPRFLKELPTRTHSGFAPDCDHAAEPACTALLTRVLEDQAQSSGAGQSPRNEGFLGKQVCFTGQSEWRVNGDPITREVAASLATAHGMIVAESVTKRLDLLVASDPLTQSGKAKRARCCGIRIMCEKEFWSVLGVEVG